MDSSSARESKGNFAGLKSTSRTGVRVVCKIRPSTESEKNCSSNPSEITISRGDNHASVILHNLVNGCKDTFLLDGCYEQDESMSKLFAHEVKPLLESILHGNNCCVIACGVQGSGKTQLIQGSVETPGLAMMAFSEIFSSIEEVGGSLAISCYEMCNDHIYDLLDCKEKEVQIMEDAEKAIQLKGLSKVLVKSLSDFEKYYFHVRKRRNLPQNVGNEVRVRSHKGLIMYVASVDKESKTSRVGKLNFMDMAGYVEVGMRTDEKISLSECIKMNKSLYALHNVVSALNGDQRCIPYREAKLTRLLQDFLCRMNNAVLITCLSPSLCPQTFPVIRLASRSCQFVNRQRYDLARSSKECRRYFPSSSSVGGIHPLDKTIIKKRIYQLGSSRKKINERVSTTNGRFQGHGNIVKKPAPSPSWPMEGKLINFASPIEKTQKLENLCNKEESAGFNVVSASSTLEVENSPLARIAKFPIMNASILADHMQGDSSLATVMTLNRSPEGSIKNEQHNSSFESGKCSPALSEQIREISNKLESLSSWPISMHKSQTDGSCGRQLTVDSEEFKTPRFPLVSKLDCNSVLQSFTTPQEKFKTRSTGLKKSLINECMDFLNSASKEELKKLKGIGEKRATYILELREETPEPFKEIDDLKGLGLSSKQIKGMMSKILADI